MVVRWYDKQSYLCSAADGRLGWDSTQGGESGLLSRLQILT